MLGSSYECHMKINKLEKSWALFWHDRDISWKTGIGVYENVWKIILCKIAGKD
jgi:hypothetical protein